MGRRRGTLYADDMTLVAMHVFAKTILRPLAGLIMMCYVLVPMAQHACHAGSTASCAAFTRRGPGA